MTAAIGMHPVSWLIYGLGFTYQHYAGEFEDFGDFRTDTYRPFLFASVTPADDVFIDATLTYARLDNTRNRAATSTATDGRLLARGIASGSPGENAYTGSILIGYDRQFGNVTVGPRVGFAAGYWNVEGYQESGTTGLELRYQSVDQISLQSTLGAAASVVFPSEFGAVLSTVTAGWVHEFAAYPRLIYAQFAQAPNSSFFTFSSQKPAADFGVVGINLSAVLPGGARPYASFGTILGNGVYQSYGGMIGVIFRL
jgi:outer membrane autotransporter protein